LHQRFFSRSSEREALETNGAGVLHAGCPSCHPSNDVIALYGMQTLTSIREDHPLTCAFVIHQLTPAGVILCVASTKTVYFVYLHEVWIILVGAVILLILWNFVLFGDFLLHSFVSCDQFCLELNVSVVMDSD